MIVLVKTADQIKKCFIRNRIFTEVDANNMNVSKTTIRTANIKTILWLENGKFTEMLLSDWMDMAEESDFWNVA